MPRKLIIIKPCRQSDQIRQFDVKARLENRRDHQAGDTAFLKIIQREVEAVVSTSKMDDCGFSVTIGKAWVEDWSDIEEQIVGHICTFVTWTRSEVIVKRPAIDDDDETEGIPNVETKVAVEEDLDAEAARLIEASTTDDSQ